MKSIAISKADFEAIYETNFSLIDEDADEITGWQRDDILKEMLDGAEWEYCVKQLLPTADDDIENLDTDEDTDMTDEMELHTISRDSAPDLVFTGVKVASARSSANNAAGSSYSGQTGRWCELELYKTRGGKFVCVEIGRTQWQGERDRYNAEVCEDNAGVIKFFGHGWLAKDLYCKAGIADAVEVE